MGEESLFGTRMAAGAVLDTLDICAGYTASKFSGSRVVTLAFDRVDLSHPILHQVWRQPHQRTLCIALGSGSGLTLCLRAVCAMTGFGASGRAGGERGAIVDGRARAGLQAGPAVAPVRACAGSSERFAFQHMGQSSQKLTNRTRTHAPRHTPHTRA